MSFQPSDTPPAVNESAPEHAGESQEVLQIVGKAVGDMDRTLQVLEETEQRLHELMQQMAQAQKRSRKSLMVDAATIGLLAAVTAFLVVLGLGLIAYLVAF